MIPGVPTDMHCAHDRAMYDCAICWPDAPEDDEPYDDEPPFGSFPEERGYDDLHGVPYAAALAEIRARHNQSYWLDVHSVRA